MHQHNGPPPSRVGLGRLEQEQHTPPYEHLRQHLSAESLSAGLTLDLGLGLEGKQRMGMVNMGEMEHFLGLRKEQGL